MAAASSSTTHACTVVSSTSVAPACLQLNSSDSQGVAKANTLFAESLQKYLMQQMTQAIAVINSNNLPPLCQQYEEIIQKLKAENEQLKKTQADLSAQSKQLNNTLSEAKAENARLKKTSAELEAQNKQLNSTVAAQQVTISQLKAENEQLKQSNAADDGDRGYDIYWNTD